MNDIEYDVKFSSKYIPALAAVVSVTHAVPIFQGVIFEPLKNGVLAVATDGHMMCVIYDKDGFAQEITTIRTDPILAEACGCPYSRHVYYKDEIGTVVDTHNNMIVSTPAKRIDGKTLGWRKIISAPEEEGGNGIRINVALLKKVAPALDLGKSKYYKDVIFNHSSNKYTVVSIPNVPEYRAIIMHMKDDENDSCGPAIPEWML